MAPRYTHDCDECCFVGSFHDATDGVDYDLYACPFEPTVVARYGDEGPDYASGLMFVGNHTALTAAWKATLEGHANKTLPQRLMDRFEPMAQRVESLAASR